MHPAGSAPLRRTATRPAGVPIGQRRGGCVHSACTNRPRACAAESGAARRALGGRQCVRRPRPQTSKHKPSLGLSCLGARRQARPPAQKRSTKALGVWQQHGGRHHGARPPGPSRRSPQASSSSSACSCRRWPEAGRRGPRPVFSTRESGQAAQQVARAHSRASLSTRSGVCTYKLHASINTYEINSAREREKLWAVLLR